MQSLNTMLLQDVGVDEMATLTIRNLEERVKKNLRLRAAIHGRSMEEEARRILRRALTGDVSDTDDLAETLRRRFEAFGGVDLPTQPREPIRQPPDLER